MKRIAVFAVAVAALLLGAGTAVAGHGDEVVVGPVDPPWVLANPSLGGECSFLPATGDAAKITMLTGIERSTTHTGTNGNGVTTIKNFTRATGTAVDQGGHVYNWLYKNQFSVSNTRDNLDVYSGIMVDSFTLDDPHGPLLLKNGFRAVITTDFASFFSSDPLNSFGDPIDFGTGAAHCDPL
ncbi:MAG TPA: hypothetical protein VJT84_04095 [Gaiellaceae bacterium]|nr:hypothetical protein [Gaiellaceae bacterium]